MNETCVDHSGNVDNIDHGADDSTDSGDDCFDDFRIDGVVDDLENSVDADDVLGNIRNGCDSGGYCWNPRAYIRY